MDDTNETRSGLQMAEVLIADNTLTGMGEEYKGAPGIHSYCEAMYWISKLFRVVYLSRRMILVGTSSSIRSRTDYFVPTIC